MARISLRGVGVEFPIYGGGSRSLKKALVHVGTGGNLARDAADRVVVRALDGLDLEVADGERLGLVGSNGAGKSTLLRVMAGIYEPVRGEVRVEGRVSALLEAGLGLNPEATGRENIFLRGLYLGLSRREIRERLEEIEAFTELGQYLEMPVRTYSAGMMLRLGFAVGTCGAPEILLMDEWVLAGDVRFLAKARQRLSGFAAQARILVLASHKEELLRQWCTRAVLLEHGRVKVAGPTAEVLAAYKAAEQRPLPVPVPVPVQE